MASKMIQVRVLADEADKVSEYTGAILNCVRRLETVKSAQMGTMKKGRKGDYICYIYIAEEGEQ